MAVVLDAVKFAPVDEVSSSTCIASLLTCHVMTQASCMAQQLCLSIAQQGVDAEEL
jgi:hypothetical protein